MFVWNYLKKFLVYCYIVIFVFGTIFIYLNYPVKMYADYPNAITKKWLDMSKKQNFEAYKRSYNAIKETYDNRSSVIRKRLLKGNEKADIYYDGQKSYLMVKNDNVYLLAHGYGEIKQNMMPQYWELREFKEDKFFDYWDEMSKTMLDENYFRLSLGVKSESGLLLYVPVFGQLCFMELGFNYNYKFFDRAGLSHYKPLLPHMLVHEYWRKVTQRLRFNMIDSSLKGVPRDFFKQLKEYSKDRENTAVYYYYNYADDLFHAKELEYYQFFRNKKKDCQNLYKIKLRFGDKIEVLNVKEISI